MEISRNPKISAVAKIVAVCERRDMKKLQAFIASEKARRKATQRVIAAEIGISEATLSLLASGKRKPSRPMIEQIEARTGGRVPAASWFPKKGQQ